MNVLNSRNRPWRIVCSFDICSYLPFPKMVIVLKKRFFVAAVLNHTRD